LTRGKNAPVRLQSERVYDRRVNYSRVADVNEAVNQIANLLFGLQWQFVDLENATVDIRVGLSEVNGEMILGPVKTTRSRRTIPLTALAVTALRDRRAAAESEGHGSPFCFVTEDGC
jgi:hypothetical protein